MLCASIRWLCQRQGQVTSDDAATTSSSAVPWSKLSPLGEGDPRGTRLRTEGQSTGLAGGVLHERPRLARHHGREDPLITLDSRSERLTLDRDGGMLDQPIHARLSCEELAIDPSLRPLGEVEALDQVVRLARGLVDLRDHPIELVEDGGNPGLAGASGTTLRTLGHGLLASLDLALQHEAEHEVLHGGESRGRQKILAVHRRQDGRQKRSKLTLLQKLAMLRDETLGSLLARQVHGLVEPATRTHHRSLAGGSRLRIAHDILRWFTLRRCLLGSR